MFPNPTRLFLLSLISLFIFSCDSDDNSTGPLLCDEGLIQIDGECVEEIIFDTNWTDDGMCESEGYFHIENVPTNIDCRDDDFSSVECGNCFYYNDLLFLNEIIINSKTGENPPNVYPYELGYQYWIQGRLQGFISISNEKILSMIGSIPGSFQEYVRDYTLYGEIPSSINSFPPNFRVFMLPFNSLSGNIPDLGNYPNMDTFDLSFNELSGPFPTGIENMINSDIINLSFNQLSGEFPNGIINNFTNTFGFNLSNNNLSGILSININPEHDDLGDMRLGFDNNSFTNITGNVCDYLDQIRGLYLGGNSLCTEVPSCISTSENFNQGISLDDLTDYSVINQNCP
tara:strand:+ start:2887 stop:3918 length:1032 start_codon:yes stop_codon:yes gene_type:complete